MKDIFQLIRLIGDDADVHSCLPLLYGIEHLMKETSFQNILPDRQNEGFKCSKDSSKLSRSRRACAHYWTTYRFDEHELLNVPVEDDANKHVLQQRRNLHQRVPLMHT